MRVESAEVKGLYAGEQTQRQVRRACAKISQSALLSDEVI